MKARATLRLLDGWLWKAQRVHQPLQAFKSTDTYAKLQGKLTSAIQEQVDQIASDLPDAGVLADTATELNSADQARLRSWLARRLTPMSQLVTLDYLQSVFTEAFEAQVKARYKLWGIRTKAADPVNFQITNPFYLGQLRNQSAALLNRSGLDDTTLNRLVSIITVGKENALTNDEIAVDIRQQFEDIADYRATMIARTEVARAMSYGDLAAMRENGVVQKSWVAAGNNPCPICTANEDQGYIGMDEYFSDGSDAPPAHPNCECYLDAGRIDLDGIDIWGGE